MALLMARDDSAHPKWNKYLEPVLSCWVMPQHVSSAACHSPIHSYLGFSPGIQCDRFLYLAG